MASLEDELSTFASLDALRDEARELVKGGLGGLSGSTYEAHERWEDARLGRARVEHALLLRALRIGYARGAIVERGHLDELEGSVRGLLVSLSPQALFPSEPGQTSLLVAGSALEALSAVPGLACSKASMACLYRVLRELFSAERPLWTMGSARAGEGSRATAFVTGACCLGILSLSRAFTRGAGLFDSLRRAHNRRTDLAAIGRLPQEWREVELRRISKSLEIDVISARAGGIFRLDRIDTRDLEATASHLRAQIDELRAEVSDARGEIVRARSNETLKLIRTEAPHRASIAAIDGLRGKLDEISRELTTLNWAEAGARMTQLAATLNELLEPSRNFIAGILDHELAAAATQRADRDLPELAFAAATFGMLHDDWHDPRLDQAAEVLVANLTESGRLQTGKPFQVQPNGFRLHVAGTEVIRALASLFRRKHYVVTPDVAAAFMRLFRENKRSVPGGIGWCTDAPIDPRKASWWGSALSIIALEQVEQMLDSCLNKRISAHFSENRVAQGGVDLDSMFYPDYGLTRVNRESVAIHMQHMRAHLLGIKREEYPPVLNSIVLYGPPGTGKTTMAKALAKSAATHFIEITPSDIVLTGAEHAEHRARVVFQALSMLTDTVILFDEFDSMLRRRLHDGKVPRSIFEILTPGMLPKLERLHDTSRFQRVAYILSTNLVGSLDDAAIREGRFDEKVGIYPPDLTSRVGRLVSLRWPLSDDQERRLLRVCAMTHDSPMSTLGRRGWFTLDDHPRPGTGQAYIDDATQTPNWPTPEFHEVKRSGEGKHADLELAEWLWSRTASLGLIGGTTPGGELGAYMRAVGWRDLRQKLAERALDWGDIGAALESRPEWESFFTWVVIECGSLSSLTTGEGSPPPESSRLLAYS